MPHQRFIHDNATKRIDIVELSSGVTTYGWLCKGHQGEKKRAGWGVKVTGTAHGKCDLCLGGENNLPVDYVPTAPESYCPPPGWVAPTIPETWAARIARLKAAR